MKSQFYHSSRFTSPFFNLIEYIYVYVCAFFFPLLLLFPRYFFLAQSRARFACRRSEVTTAPFVNVLWFFFFRSVSHARNRAQQPRNKICNRKSRCIASRLVSLVRMEEPRLVSSRRALTHPSSRRVRQLARERDPQSPLLFIISIQK